VPLGYVSTQLGHADVSVTARHYARWVEAEYYRVPLVLQTGEVPADFLVRLPMSPQSPPTSDETLSSDALGDWSYGINGTPGGIRTPDPQVRRRIPTRGRSIGYALGTGIERRMAANSGTWGDTKRLKRHPRGTNSRAPRGGLAQQRTAT